MASATTQSDARSFYSFPDQDLSEAVCLGTACFVARPGVLFKSDGDPATVPHVFCYGKCYAAPANFQTSARPRLAVRSKESVILARVAKGGAHTLDEYERQDGLAGLRRALLLGAERTIAEIERSELRGRGGAAFCTGRKWQTAASQTSPEKFVVANLDEGDPGAYIDRFLAEDDPFCLLEGMAIAASAIGAHRGWIYARCEYPDAIARLQSAIEQARQGGLLGTAVLGSDFAFDVELAVGHGSYVCGEETSLLSSLEGKRPVARVRPPYTAERGLWNAPTIVNNVETLANVPWIMRHGGHAFAGLGIPGSRGTKCLSLNSLFRHPGLYEVDFGTPLDQIVDDVGGGLVTGQLVGLWIGGPLAGVIPPALLDARLGFDELRAIGASVGHGGVIAFDERTSIRNLVKHVFEFGAFESCGQCTPCRLGTSRIARLLSDKSVPAGSSSREEFEDIIAALKHASLCGLGTGLAEFAESIMRHYGEELRRCFE